APQNTGKAAMNRRRERTSIADAIADKTDREARHEREAAEAKRNAASSRKWTKPTGRGWGHDDARANDERADACVSDVRFTLRSRHYRNARACPLRANCGRDSTSYSLGKFGSMAYGFNSMSIWIKDKGSEVVGVVLRT